MASEHGRPTVLRLAGVYAVTAAGVWGAADILVDALSLPSAVLSALVIASVCGFPIVILLGWYRNRQIQSRVSSKAAKPVDHHPSAHLGRSRTPSPFQRYARATGLVLAGTLALWGAFSVARGLVLNARSSRTAQLTARLSQLADAREYEAAFSVAVLGLPDDSIYEELWNSFSVRVPNIASEPPGAVVARRSYADPTAEWQPLGRTPIAGIRVPRGMSVYRLHLDGHEPLEMGTPPPTVGGMAVQLAREGLVPEGMVFVPAGRVSIPNYDYASMDLSAYLINRYEVTNAEFAEFVRGGGYVDPTYWTDTLLIEGRRVDWQEAMERFTDRTGRPGPATWIAGDFPDGQDRYPVRGVSWFEARAYARFVERDLPTVFHWHRAARVDLASYVIPNSNFGGESVVAVGTTLGTTGWGTSDMAGNVREWVANASGSERFILGGAWNDNPYLFPLAYAADPWDRSEKNGFRLAEYLDRSDLAEASRPLDLPYRDYTAEAPVSDEVFAAFRTSYAYDERPVESTIIDADTTSDWIVQRVAFNAAYNRDTVVADLYMPLTATAPFQAVVYMPGSGAVTTGLVLDDVRKAFPLDFIVKTGRAVLLPAYDGTYDRRKGDLTTTRASPTYLHAEYTARWVKDIRRSIDFLGSREDIDARRIGFFGTSWGGRVGGIVLAIEPRFEAAVLYLGGFRPERAMPVADDINYVTRVRTPVLMINGRDDHLRPLEKSQKPFFDLLGTEPVHKAHKVFPGGHYVSRSDLIRETLTWFDRYLGQVEANSR
jgi:dienelactone hydrolase